MKLFRCLFAALAFASVFAHDASAAGTGSCDSALFTLDATGCSGSGESESFVVNATAGTGGGDCAAFTFESMSKQNQTITFTALPIKTVGDSDFDPGAHSTSGLTISYDSSDMSVATIVSGKIHIVGAGTSTITASQMGDATYNAAGDIEQTLTVQPKTYTVTFVLTTKGTWTGGGALSQTISHGSAATAPTFSTQTGWTFTGWDVAFNNVTSNLTVTAQYSVTTYNVSFAAGANGSISGSTPQTVNHGSSCSAVTAVPHAGYQFAKWTKGGLDYSKGISLTVTNVTANMSFTAEFSEYAASPESDFVFNPATHTITGYTGPGGTVVIPATIDGVNVTAIRDGAFDGCGSLTGVRIPNGVTSIGFFAFANCSLLTSVVIPDGVTSIGNGAFTGCSSLASAYFEGDAPASFGSGVFDSTAPDFTIYYKSTNTGFDTPIWKGYPCYPYDYTVVYDGNDKTSGTAPHKRSYLANATVTVAVNSGNLAKTGYSFAVWNIQADGGGTDYTAGTGTFPITADTTLYAKFAVNCVSILTDSDTINVPEGTTSTFGVKLSAQPTESKTVAVSWTSGDSDISVSSGSSLTFSTSDWDSYKTVTLVAAEDADTTNGSAVIRCSCAGMNNKDVTATEADNDYTLTVNNDGNGTTNPSGASARTKGAAVSISATENAGYHFVNWTGDIAGVAGVNDATTTITSSVPTYITANFAINTYTVTFDLAGKGTSSDSLVQTVNHGSAATAPAVTANPGWTFTGWDKSFSNITSNLTVMAQYSVTTYTITASASTNGSITPSATVNYGTDKTFTITPSTGYHVADVLVDTVSKGEVANYTFSNVTENHTISASFTIDAGACSISGTVSGAVTQGVTLTLSGTSSSTTTSGADGSFIFAERSNGLYTVTPSLSGHTFTPLSRNVTINGKNVTGCDFVATKNPGVYSISGTVSGAIQEGVMITLSGALSSTTVSSTDGSYSFTGLADGSYIVTPKLSGYTFAPFSQEVAIAGANQTGVDFTSTAISVYGDTSKLSFNSSHKDSIKKIDGSYVQYSTDKFMAQATIQFPADFNLTTIGESTGFTFDFGFYSFSGTLGNAIPKKLNREKGGSATFKITGDDAIKAKAVTVEKVDLKWDKKKKLTVKIAGTPASNSGTNILDLSSKVDNPSITGTIDTFFLTFNNAGARFAEGDLLAYTGKKTTKTVIKDKGKPSEKTFTLVDWSAKGKK